MSFLLAPLLLLGANTPAALPQSEENPPDPHLGRGPRVYHPTTEPSPRPRSSDSFERRQKAAAKRARKADALRARAAGGGL